MKIRYGFVSNSSSCAYLLIYKDDSVTTDPLEVIKALQEHPNQDIIFDGGPFGEGSDIFPLDPDMKSLIRKFPKEFAAQCSGMQDDVEYHSNGDDTYTTTVNQIPKLVAYIGDAFLTPCPDESYTEWDVDMSDIPNPCPQYGEVDNWKGYLEDAESRKRIDDWYDLREQRWEAHRKQEVAEAAKSWTDKGYKVRDVRVEYRACDDTYEFKDRFLASESIDGYYGINRHYSTLEDRPYLLTYSDIIKDKDKIIDVVKTLSTPSSLALANYNEVFESDSETVDMDLYMLGEKEIGLLLNNSDSFIKSGRSVMLFTDAKVFHNGDDTSSLGAKLYLGYGKIAEIAPGQDVEDFKNTFITEDDY